MEVAGKYGCFFIVCRCCKKGRWNITYLNDGVVTLFCNHIGDFTTCIVDDIFDLNEVKDLNIIHEVMSPPENTIEMRKAKIEQIFNGNL
jgi:hypothetical protein